ncbi:histidine kinase [Lentzea sp. NBRC 105346]|uniref:sensor histidine kinase n=1 Tax=Lentzea sp. NBRC 105346 TaxID=3032205 RepID=UPI00255641E1|nr:histidine kinase [Lentzea sp. NBRC 105346]
MAVIGALCAIQLSYFSRRPAPLTGYTALAVQAALLAVPPMLFGHTWVAVTGFLAGNTLLVLPKVAGWIAFAAVALAAALGHGATEAALIFVTTVLAGFVVHGLPWLAALAVKIEQACSDVARDAVAEERVRVSRDLHDLLGYGLSAIKLKSELTHRLLPDNPELARETLREIVDITRHTLVDVRSVALGYRLMSVQESFSSAQAVLASANVAVRMDLDHGDIPEPVATVLSTVLRESVTNVLRHSKAEQCDISLRQSGNVVVLDIVNDGAGQEEGRSSGSGVRNMTERVQEIGGLFSSRLDGDRFHLHASIPVA